MAKPKPHDVEAYVKKQARALEAKRAKRDTIALPEGFIRHKGGDCPIDPNDYIEPIVRTSEGFGVGSIAQARFSEWPHDMHEAGLGAIVAYRPAQRGEANTFPLDYRFKIKRLT